MTQLMPWLLPAPSDFRAQLKQIGEADARSLIDLANRDLDVTQLGRLSIAISKLHAALAGLGTLARMRLGVVSSHTTDYIMEALPATALRHSLLLSCVASNFGQVAQSVLDPASPLVGNVDAVLLALDARMLGLDRAQLSDGAGELAVENAIQTMRSLCEGVRGNLNSFCILTTLAPPADTLFGSLDSRVSGTQRQMIEAFNARLASDVLSGADVLVDVAHLAATVGLSQWNDSRSWHSAKLPFGLDFTPLYVDQICRTLAAVRGKARKCLVLDLDNTLWGGIIGDDGLEGIKLGQGSAVGEAHVELQRFAMELRDRGIILAVCSKNEDENARLPFREHPEMILKEDHIAAFVANWTDKASNLRDIAATLNIGTDSLVFLDDNPAERAIIRRELPEVAVPEIGTDAADYVAAIARAGWFESLAFSEEDRKRASYYQANAERRHVQGNITNMADYLLSLEMVATIIPFDPIGRSRISQLVNKSNQFNLTTRRYTEADIEAFETSADAFTVQVRLEDRFGDNGMISVIIFKKGPEVWNCDTWLMSCRVLGRRVEEAVLDHVAIAAKAAGAKRLRGTYLPTKKNALVERHFEKLGFSRVDTLADGGVIWELDLSGYVGSELPMVVQLVD